MKKKILALLLTLVTVLMLVFSSPISAKSGDDSLKPGYGRGDSGREHYGPTGQEVKDGRPGWGYGDKNHIHYGYGYGNMYKDHK